MSHSAKQFVRYYLEMVVAMVVGMIILGRASELFDLPDETEVTLVEKASR